MLDTSQYYPILQIHRKKSLFSVYTFFCVTINLSDIFLRMLITVVTFKSDYAPGCMRTSNTSLCSTNLLGLYLVGSNYTTI
jgi:hypothetical protein